MNINNVIETKNLLIRSLKPYDITTEYVNGLNDSDVNRFLVNVRLVRQSRKTVENFILKNIQSKQDMLLGVFLKPENTFIGTIRISDISSFHFSCNIGICFFNKNYWGKGYATEALSRMCDFIFKKMGLRYIEAGIYSKNTASIKLFRRAGFSLCATYPDKYRWYDSFEEVNVFCIVNPNFNHELILKKKT